MTYLYSASSLDYYKTFLRIYSSCCSSSRFLLFSAICEDLIISLSFSILDFFLISDRFMV